MCLFVNSILSDKIAYEGLTKYTIKEIIVLRRSSTVARINYQEGCILLFGRIGLPELILILVIALIIFGPRKLPEIGRSIGKGIRELRQATTEISKTVSLDDLEDEKSEQKV
jgi:sec-independent protein translocase protein TatA